MHILEKVLIKTIAACVLNDVGCRTYSMMKLGLNTPNPSFIFSGRFGLEIVECGIRLRD